MAASLRTLLRPQLASRLALARTPAAAAARRCFNADAAPVIYSSSAHITGARSGHVQGDGLSVDLTMPKAVGGPGEAGKTNPEELFAAGYGACFQSAMNASAASLGVKMPTKEDDFSVDSTVHLVGSLKELDMGIKVDMVVKVRGMDKGQLDKVVQKTKEVCPYSRATRGNVTTNVKVEML